MSPDAPHPEAAAVAGSPSEAVETATAWFLAARAMVIAGGGDPDDDDAAAGLYAQAILGVSEDDCVAAKAPEHMGPRTLVDCLAIVERLPEPVREQLVTGVMMISYAEHAMTRLEVRWASILASAAGLDVDGFQRCCSQARVIAAMLRPDGAPGEFGSDEVGGEPIDRDPDGAGA